TALGDVAEANAAAVLEVFTPVALVDRVQLQPGRPNEVARSHEGALRLVVPEHVADVLAQEAFDALPVLLDALDVLLLPAPLLLRHVGRRGERRDRLVEL